MTSKTNNEIFQVENDEQISTVENTLLALESIMETFRIPPDSLFHYKDSL